MRVNVIQTLAGILSGIKINKVKDKKVKADLLRDYLTLHKVEKEANEEKDAIAEKFRSDWKDDLAPVQAFRDAGKPVAGYDDFLDAEQDALEAMAEVLSREVEVSLEKVPADMLYDSELWPDDITLGQIPGTIDFLIEYGVAE